jgi:nucleoredoxin
MTSFDFATLFGATLSGSSGDIPTSSINGKNVMIYFSAHWCPPCRGFTPKLSEWYTNLKKTNSDFELVFVSSDSDEAAFKEYFGEMPFLALPYAERDAKAALSKKYKVSGIPSLVVVGSDGELITADGRTNVMEDPSGKNFPWTPKTFEQTLPSKLASKDGEVASSSLDDKHLMLYFSAHWCPPCRGFTPELVKVYEELKKTRSDLELVFVSSDRDEAAFDEYYAEMPWMALPYAERDAKKDLSKIFNVDGIPSLVVLGPKVNGTREVINGSARGSASMDNVADFPWYPKPYGDLSETVECNGSDINESPAIVVLCESADDDEQKEIIAAVKAVASKQDKDSEMLFFYGAKSGGFVDRVRQLCGVDGKKDEVTMIKLDIPDNGGYYISDSKDITLDSIEEFMASPGNRVQLG